MEKSQKHWNEIYAKKKADEVSWTQDVPQTSLDFIQSFNISKDSSIIDIGGGDSKLVDFLLDAGYTNLTVLDISEKALDRAKERLGSRASKVKWIVSDVLDFIPTQRYEVWHDRAAFHFLTIGTFSDNGPEKCSGLTIKNYNEHQLQQTFLQGFTKIRCLREDHITPFNTTQNFLFCSFKVNIKSDTTYPM